MDSNNESLYFCRICGLRQIDLPWGEDNNSPNFDLCPCCNVEFGYEDCNISAIRNYRSKWLENGAQWTEPNKKPINWSLEEQMKNIPSNYL